MKLLKDFGVRALLATIAASAFYILLSFAFFLFRASLDMATLVALIGMAQAPFLAAMAFYFAGKKQTNK